MDEELQKRAKEYLEKCEQDFLKEMKKRQSKIDDFVITMNDGREIRMDQFHQQKSYPGIILGHPRPGGFDRHIEDVEEKYGKYLDGNRSKFHVIRPELLTKNLYQEWMPKEWKKGLFNRSKELIPPICCVASFTSLTACNGSDDYLSQLSLIWWQHNWAMPIEDEVLKEIKNLDWSELAIDYLD